MPSDYLLEIQGIKGESQDSKHPHTIEIESFSWGNTNSGTAHLGTGAGSGKVQYQDFHFSTHVNIASPDLALACANGKHFTKAQLFVRKQGQDQKDFYVITLEDFIVSSYQSGGSNGSNVLPMDQFSLNFSKIRYEYKAQTKEGTLGAVVTSGWDLKANVKA